MRSKNEFEDESGACTVATVFSTIQEWRIQASSAHNDGWTQNFYREKLNMVYDLVRDVPKKFKFYGSNDTSVN